MPRIVPPITGTPKRLEGQPWSLRDAASYLGISLRHLIALADDGKIATFRLGRRRFIGAAEMTRVATKGV